MSKILVWWQPLLTGLLTHRWWASLWPSHIRSATKLWNIQHQLYSVGQHDLYRSKSLNISFKCCSKCKSGDSFENCSSWGFQNTPNMLKLIEFWLRYLRSKTNDMILKYSSKLVEVDEKLTKTKLFVTKIIWLFLGTSMSIRIIF